MRASSLAPNRYAVPLVSPMIATPSLPPPMCTGAAPARFLRRLRVGLVTSARSMVSSCAGVIGVASSGCLLHDLLHFFFQRGLGERHHDVAARSPQAGRNALN